MNKKLSILLVVVAIVVAGYLFYRNRSKNSVVPGGIVPDDGLGNTGGGTTDVPGRTPVDNGNGLTPVGGGGSSSAPRLVSFEDFTAMRNIGNDGRRLVRGALSYDRPTTDPLYNATGFMVKSGADLSRYQVGEFVRVKAAANNDNPHFDTGAMEIKALIPALPGHGTQIRGTWVVTNAGWRNGSTGPERGTLEIL